jgi:hypothetical protein
MEKHYEGLPAAATMQQSIILAQLQILRDLERRTRGANTQLSIDPVARLVAEAWTAIPFLCRVQALRNGPGVE